jgi:hypothetical protein
VGCGRIEVCAISVPELLELKRNDVPKSSEADPGISLEQEYSRTSKNWPRSINSLRFCRVGSSLATYVDETVSASRCNLSAYKQLAVVNSSSHHLQFSPYAAILSPSSE